MVRLVEHDVIGQLDGHPDFTGRAAEDVAVVVRACIRYVAYRLSNMASFMRADFDDENVIEQHLADDLERFLAASPLSRGTVDVEVQRIGGGRADLVVGFATHRVIVELKREQSDASRSALEGHYADQAASYQAADYPFGVAMVLDLSAEQTRTLAHLRDLIWTSDAASDGQSPRRLVWCLVPGRRVTPSTLSRA